MAKAKEPPLQGSIRERLGIPPDEIHGGHLIALSRPQELAERPVGYVADLEAAIP